MQYERTHAKPFYVDSFKNLVIGESNYVKFLKEGTISPEAKKTLVTQKKVNDDSKHVVAIERYELSGAVKLVYYIIKVCSSRSIEHIADFLNDTFEPVKSPKRIRSEYGLVTLSTDKGECTFGTEQGCIGYKYNLDDKDDFLMNFFIDSDISFEAVKELLGKVFDFKM